MPGERYQRYHEEKARGGIAMTMFVGLSVRLLPESRFLASHATELTTLVGRDPELNELLRCWKEVKRGTPRLILISGEPGVGKSRLGHGITRLGHIKTGRPGRRQHTYIKGNSAVEENWHPLDTALFS